MDQARPRPATTGFDCSGLPEELEGGLELEPEAPRDVPAWELIDAEIGRYLPRRIRGSFRGRALG